MLSIPSFKPCTKCGKVLPSDQFHKNTRNASGLGSWCKTCKNLSQEKVTARPKLEVTEKTCTKCERLLPIEQFCNNKNTSDGHVYWCKDCTIAQSNNWYENNREYANQKSKEKYYANHEASLTYRRQYHAANKDRHVVWSRLWQQRNKDKVSERNRSWRLRNPDKTLIHRRNRIARLYKAEGTHTAEQFQALIDYYGDKCLCCGEQKPLTADHVIALANGGTNDIGNMQPLCASCNYSKAAWHNTDYRPDGGDFARSIK